MRIGLNPYKDKMIDNSDYLHQIIIPVYIPDLDGYFKDSFEVVQLCLQSVFDTTHDKTFITIINNGSCAVVKKYLNSLLESQLIHELIHTTNIGKLNSILKGIAGHNIELITIADADVLFLKGWQSETATIYNTIPKVGVVGLVPSFNLHKTNSFNLIFDNFVNNKLRFIKVKNPDAIIKFYNSINRDISKDQDYLKYNLGLIWSQNLSVLVGASHFVATYKSDMFTDIIRNIPYKMGGTSESYLDQAPLKKDYWRVTTQENFAYHIGNTPEDWMINVNNQTSKIIQDTTYKDFRKLTQISKLNFLIKNKMLHRLLKKKLIYKIFLRWKKLPIDLVKNY